MNEQQLKTHRALENRFIAVMIATFLVNSTSMCFSFASGSISLISDGIHALFDIILIFGCFISVRLTRKNSQSQHFSYDNHRLELWVSIIINIAFLALLFMCVVQSIVRLNIKLFNSGLEQTVELNSEYMIISASISILGDLVIIYLMKTKREMRTFYHAFSRCC